MNAIYFPLFPVIYSRNYKYKRHHNFVHLVWPSNKQYSQNTPNDQGYKTNLRHSVVLLFV